MSTQVLSRGQKAAATRRANAAAKAKAEAKAIATAKRKTRAAVGTSAERQASLTQLSKAKREAIAKAAKDAAVMAQAKAHNTVEAQAKRPLHELRAEAAKAGAGSGYSSLAYGLALNNKFKDYWRDTQVQNSTAFKNERDAFFAAFKAEFNARNAPGRANPSLYFGNAKRAVEKYFATPKAKDSRGKRVPKSPYELIKDTVPALYMRANKSDRFDRDEKLQEIGRLSAALLKLAGVSVAALNAKLGAE